MIVLVEHQKSFNGRVGWDEMRELSIVEFLRGARVIKRVKSESEMMKKFSH